MTEFAVPLSGLQSISVVVEGDSKRTVKKRKVGRIDAEGKRRRQDNEGDVVQVIGIFELPLK